jgi:hypothetical protein
LASSRLPFKNSYFAEVYYPFEIPALLIMAFMHSIVVVVVVLMACWSMVAASPANRPGTYARLQMAPSYILILQYEVETRVSIKDGVWILGLIPHLSLDSLRVTSPLGSPHWKQGSWQGVSWDASGLLPPFTNFRLDCDVVVQQVLGDNVNGPILDFGTFPCGNGYAGRQIPFSLPKGTYLARVAAFVLPRTKGAPVAQAVSEYFIVD